MTVKSLLFLSLSGSNSRLPDSRYDDIGVSSDDVDWVKESLDSLGVLSEIHFRAVRAYQYEPIPKPEDFDAVILGGSYHSVNDRYEWQIDVLRCSSFTERQDGQCWASAVVIS